MDTPIEIFRYLTLGLQREGNRRYAEALRPLGLSPAQAEVLRVLDAFGPLSLKGLAERLVCENGMPSRLVHGMTKAGLVAKTRSPADGRAVVISLTDTAQALLPDLNAIEDSYHQMLSTWLQDLPLDDTIALMQRMLEGTEPGRAVALRREHARDTSDT